MTNGVLFDKIKALCTSKWLIWIIIGFGVLVRVARYLANRPLSNDESIVAVEIINRQSLEFLKPLETTAAPLGFIFAEKSIITILGYSEYALRLLPLLAGVASIFLFYFVARRFLNSNILPIALLLFASSSTLLDSSTGLKPYSTDVATALALYFIAVYYIENEKLDLYSVALLSLVGAVSLWFSFISSFILAGIGLILGVKSLINRKYLNVVFLGFVYLIWLLSFLYFVPLNEMTQKPIIASFWHDPKRLSAFMPLPPSSLDDFLWFIKTFFIFVMNCIDHTHKASSAFLFSPAVVALVIGFVHSYSRKKSFFGFNIVLLVIILFASGLKKYPITDRHQLFVVPLIFILIGMGLEWIKNKTARKPILFAILVFLILLPPIIKAVYRFTKLSPSEETRTAVEYMCKRRDAKADAVFVFYRADAEFDYYVMRFGQGIRWRKKIFKFIEDKEDNFASAITKNNYKKAWFLFTLNNKKEINNKNSTLDYLNEIGVIEDYYEAPEAAAYLYKLQK